MNQYIKYSFSLDGGEFVVVVVIGFLVALACRLPLHPKVAKLYLFVEGNPWKTFPKLLYFFGKNKSSMVVSGSPERW